MIRGIFLFNLFLFISAASWAQSSADFVARANLKEADGWDCKFSRVDVDPNGQPISYDSNIPAVFDFGVLEEMDDVDGNPLGVFNRPFYFICDIVLYHGTGRPDIQIKFVETPGNPNAISNQNNGHGIGWKGFITVTGVDQNVFENPNDDTESDPPIYQKRLNLIPPGGITIPSNSFWVPSGAGFEYHFPRIALGLAMGNESFAPQNELPEPFTNADSYGLYQGTLIITVTDVD